MIQITIEFKDLETAIEALARIRGQAETLAPALAVAAEVQKENPKPPKPAKVEPVADTKPIATVEEVGASESQKPEPVMDLAELAVLITKANVKNKPALMEILNGFPHKDDASKPAGKGSMMRDEDRAKAAAKLRELLA